MSERITLWGRKNSANVQKVIWVLEELAIPYRRIDAGGKFGQLDSVEFAAKNPNRLVPVIEDKNLVLWESHAIVRYICANYGLGTLWPEAPRQRAIADQWTDWTATVFQPAWIGLFWAFVRTPAARRNLKRVQKYLSATIAAFDILNQRLADAPFLAGDHLTYADIVAGVALYRWTKMGLEQPLHPNVAAWHKRLLQRPAFMNAVCVPFDDLVGREDF